MFRLVLELNRSAVIGTGFSFPGRKVDIGFNHPVLQLMVNSDLPSHLLEFKGMVLRTGINFTFSYSNDDHTEKTYMALKYSRISYENYKVTSHVESYKVYICLF
jgi:hypothetical protein